MKISRRGLLATAAVAAASPAARARSETSTIKIGVLTDMSGAYRDVTGPTSVACARQAVEDFAAAGKPVNVELVVADHQNKPDVGVGIARSWLDNDGVDVIVDVPTSSVALAVQTVVREKNKVFIATGPASTALTGEQCSPNCLHWAYDIYMLSHVAGSAILAAGGNSWFFITADYVFGHQLQESTASVVEKSGGKVMGSAAYPFPDTTDFSSYLIRAGASGANVLAFANAGNDTVNSLKQAREFGLGERMKFAGLLATLPVVHGAGLETAQGMLLTESFYWDLNDRTRAFTRRLLSKTQSAHPNEAQAGSYAGTLHYLKTVADLGVAAAKADGRATVARMKAMKFDDDAFGTGTIREDGRVMVTAYLFQVKTPEESSGEWDLYKLLATVPSDQAFRPLAEGKCGFVKG